MTPTISTTCLSFGNAACTASFAALLTCTLRVISTASPMIAISAASKAELSMPEGSGRALSTRLRRYFPQMRTLYVARPGLAPESADVLVRPFSSSELLARVRACVSSSPAS